MRIALLFSVTFHAAAIGVMALITFGALDWEHSVAAGRPLVLRVSCLFDAFFQTPALLFVSWGLLRRRDWVRPLALFYAGAAVTNMFFYFATTFMGPTPPPHLEVYLPFNLPWLIAPALLAWRMWPEEPFA